MSKKRYTTDNGSNEDVCLVDNVTEKEFESDFDEIVDLLNEQEETIQELKQTIDTIAKDYEESHGMDIRNAEWFTAW